MPIHIYDELLRGGWEPDAPIDGTLLRRYLENCRASIAAEVTLAGGEILDQVDVLASDFGDDGSFRNLAILQAPVLERDLDPLMESIDTFYGFAATGKTGPVVLFSPWPTPDFRAKGWTLLDYMPFMVRPVGGELPVPPPTLRIEKVRDAAGLLAFEKVIVNGFPFGELAASRPGEVFVPELLSLPNHHYWVGWDGDVPVTAATASVSHGVNNVSLVATLPEARRKGYAKAISGVASLADPTLPSVLIASPPGAPAYEQLGYIPLFRFGLWLKDRPDVNAGSTGA